MLVLIRVTAEPAAAASFDPKVETLPIVDKQDQDIRFVPLSVGGQLFRKRALALAQDNHGFIWIGTEDGLYRYDGYILKGYRNDPHDARSLSDNTPFAIYQDRSGNLWIGTGYGGLNRFDPAQDAFVHYRHDPGDNHSLRDDHVLPIYQDLQGELWVGTETELDRLDAATGVLLPLSVPFPAEAAHLLHIGAL